MSVPSDPPDEPPESEEPKRRLVLSEELPLTIFVGVATAVVFSLIDLSSEWTLVGVATAPLVADVIKNYVVGRGWTKRRLAFLTVLLVFFGRVKEALARPVRRVPLLRRLESSTRVVGRPRWYAIAATAAVASGLTIALFTLPEVARGEALLADRKTTFFDGEREERMVRLVVETTGTGSGTVTTAPPAIDCGSSCSAEFAAGQRLVLTATAAQRAEFEGWRGGGCSGTDSCALTMNDDAMVVASFRRTGRTFRLSISKRGEGQGIVTSGPSGIDCGATCSAQFPQGGLVELNARAAAGSVFSGWRGGGCSGLRSCAVSLQRATDVVALFRLAEEETVRLAVELAGEGTGSVVSDRSGIDCEPRCDAEFPRGEEVRLTARASTGSEFAGWSGGGCGGLRPCSVVLEEATTVTATFEPAAEPTAVLTVRVEGEGSVESNPSGVLCKPSCQARFPIGDPVSLTATAAVGSAFVGWRDSGCAGTGACVVTMSGPQRVTAFFTPRAKTFTLTVEIVEEGGTGTVTSRPPGIRCAPFCSRRFRAGREVTLTASAADQSEFDGWEGACSRRNSCTLTVNRDLDVTARFSSSVD